MNQAFDKTHYVDFRPIAMPVPTHYMYGKISLGFWALEFT